MTKLKWPDLTRTAVALEKFDIWEAGEGQRLFDNAMTNDAVEIATTQQRAQTMLVAEAFYFDTADRNNVGCIAAISIEYIRSCVVAWSKQKKKQK